MIIPGIHVFGYKCLILNYRSELSIVPLIFELKQNEN